MYICNVENTGTYKTRSASNPNDIVDAIFTDRQFIYDLTKETAKNSLFPVNRRIAIKSPDMVNAFNIPCINEADVIKFYCDIFCSGRKPGWLFTPGAKKASDKKKEKDAVTKDQIKRYRDFYNLSQREVEERLALITDYTIGQIKMLDDLENGRNINERKIKH